MKKLTPWFNQDQKPVREGVYEVKYHLFEDEWAEGFSYWNGKEWSNCLSEVRSAYANKSWTEGAIQDKKWRGLMQEAK